jgi:predicted RNase H-like nuclease
MTNILLEQGDHEDVTKSNSEEAETIICEYVGIFLNYLEHKRFEYGDDVTHSILLQHVHTAGLHRSAGV